MYLSHEPFYISVNFWNNYQKFQYALLIVVIIHYQMNLNNIPTTIDPMIAEKNVDGFYRLIDDPQQKRHYRVMNRSAPILQQIHQMTVPGIRAVSDSLVYVPEDSLNQTNQATFAQHAAYLDQHRLGTADSKTFNEVMALDTQNQKSAQEKGCVRIDPCPDPPYKDLKCCENDVSPDAALQPKRGDAFRHPMDIRDYNFNDSTWGFMIDRPYDKYAMMIMGIAVAIAIFAVLVLLVWAMLTSNSN